MSHLCDTTVQLECRFAEIFTGTKSFIICLLQETTSPCSTGFVFALQSFSSFVHFPGNLQLRKSGPRKRSDISGRIPPHGPLTAKAVSIQAKRFYVSGTVQGVGYRFFVQRLAMRLGIAGYVKNLRDGRVEVYALGSASQLEGLRAELARGPRGAQVSEVAEGDARLDEGFADSFTIEHDSW
jgi:acylphosphatase